ncbi:MAG: hypothetical protein HPY53_03710 [Brevinematales bacterium]|nr:hypothetical protein [Brevinematales bacterium]
MGAEKTASTLFTIAIILLVLGGLTLIPSPGASKACLLGYKAKCSFTPVSTIILLAAAGVLFFLRARAMG